MTDTRDKPLITVAGATGFVGSNLVSALAGRGSRVRALVHERSPHMRLSEVEYFEADLRNRESTRSALQGTDVFVMAAAKSSGAGVMAQSPLAHLSPNLIMNANSVEAALECGVKKYVFISSSTVYPPGSQAMREDDVTGEFFPAYEVVAGMKRYSEVMLLQHQIFGSTGLEVINVRPSNLYGPGDKFSENEAKVIPSLIRRASNRENPFVVWGDGSDIKDFLFINDFVDALLRVIDGSVKQTAINISSGTSVSLQVVIREVLKSSGYQDAEVQFDTSKPVMIPVRRVDSSLALNILGWTPATSLKEGIRRTIAWFEEAKRLGRIF